ncbi:DNA-binding response OmpR family regulator [Sphingopyxis panaciterrae]|uniref:response regulator transcription factor n=1 Tax=Sphingopyxis panaciterrae TaxID=363841 RepID=UPI0014219FFF|nr:response regulator transcription factor [Sphingopyxis panaciterrae]NIJ38138.1 DNA-binding response OmpR family regulator [Sphingopyxis panaciterrae]
MRALLVEDDPDLADDVARALGAAGFVVDRCGDGEDAWFQGDVEDYAVAILDLGLPRLDGLSVLRRWRSASRTMPVLILTARGDWTEKVEGIDAGADDYMAKPFAVGELVARVRALVRRASGHASTVLTVGRMAIDTARMAATVDGRQTPLSQLEFRLLNYLAHRQDHIVPAGEIAEHLYGASDGSDTNAIEAIVTRIRRKFGGAVIETRRGLGYRLTGLTG